MNPDTGYPALKNSIPSLSSFVKTRYVDFAGRLILNDKGEVEVNFGKYKGKTAREVYQNDPSYFDWVGRSDFLLDTKREFARLKEQFEAERKKPLSANEAASAAEALQNKFGSGKLF